MKIAMMAFCISFSFSALATDKNEITFETQVKELKKEKKESNWAKKLRIALAKNQGPLARL